MSAVRLRECAEYASRWLVWVFCFGVFGLGMLVLALIVVPAVAVTSADRATRIRRMRRAVSASVRLFVGLIAKLRGISYEVAGAAPPAGAHLIVANHPTLIDALLLMSLFPDAECVAKHELLRNPLTGIVLRSVDFISNADTAQMLERATERLRAGHSLIVFPEGTRSVPGEPSRFRLAAAAMAVRSGVPCLPVIVHCRPVTLPKHRPWYRISARRPRYLLQIEPPVDVAPFVAGGDLRYAKRRLNVFLEDHYNRALGRAPQRAPAAVREPRHLPATEHRLAGNQR